MGSWTPTDPANTPSRETEALTAPLPAPDKGNDFNNDDGGGGKEGYKI